MCLFCEIIDFLTDIWYNKLKFLWGVNMCNDYYFIWKAYNTVDKYEYVKKSFDSKEEFYHYCFWNILNKEDELTQTNGTIITEQEYQELISNEQNCFILGSGQFDYTNSKHTRTNLLYKEIICSEVKNYFVNEDIENFMNCWEL